MRVLTRIVFGLVVILVMSPLRLGVVDEATKRAMDNYAIVSFAFDVSREGHISNIRVALIFDKRMRWSELRKRSESLILFSLGARAFSITR